MGRFAKLVNTPEGMGAFRAKYRTLEDIVIEHYELGKWHARRPTGVVVNPMIAFIKGGIKIPMGRVMRDFLINFRLSPTQCSPNLFRVLSSVDMLNRKMGTHLTYHDVNWVCNCQRGKNTCYYFKCRV